MAGERKNEESGPKAGTKEKAKSQVRIRWDDARMQTTYANAANVASTREEVVLLFGVNQAWHAGQAEVPIQLSNRIILSPFAAKRLSALLSNVLREYEHRFGEINVENRRSAS